MTRSFLALIVSGCAADGDGRRIAPIVFRAPGVPDRASAWQDTELGVECLLATASDGETRCLPHSSYSFTNLYGDAACTRPLFLASGCGDDGPPLALVPHYDSTSYRAEVWELEPAPQQLPTLFNAPLGGSGMTSACTAAHELSVSALRESGRPVWQGKRIVAPPRFVRVVGEERSQGTPARVDNVLEDGARIGREVRDQNDEICGLAAFAQGATCLASLSIPNEYEFADAACSEPHYPSSFTTPKLTLETSGCADLPPVRVFDLVPREASPHNITSDGRCVARDVPRTLYVRGAERTFASLPQVELRREGSQRLQLLTYIDDRGERIGTEGYWDRELSIFCGPARMEDGSYRCVPNVFAWSAPLAPSCQELRTVVGCTEAGEGLLVRELGACGANVVRVGAARERLATLCSPSQFPRSSGPLFERTQPLPTSMFAAFERVVP